LAPVWVSGLVTSTSTGPSTALAGATAVIVVALTNLTPVALIPPKVTVAPSTNSEPVMVTAVPPAVEPMLRTTLSMLGDMATAADQYSADKNRRVGRRERRSNCIPG